MDVDFDEVDEKGDLTPEMQNLVNELDARPDTAPYAFYFDFEDGSTILIKICSGQHNYFDDCIWSNGNDDYVFDCFYSISEVNEFNYNQTIYICKFIIKED